MPQTVVSLDELERGSAGPRSVSLDDLSAPRRGPIEPGNIDLFAQPKVKNPDGTTSTVDSSSYNIDGVEVLLPSVTPDGRHLQTEDEIVGEYRRTGRHLGKFATPDAATAYASQLHDDYAAGKYDRPSQPSIFDRPDKLEL